jgi:IS66 Orf2 like protein
MGCSQPVPPEYDASFPASPADAPAGEISQRSRDLLRIRIASTWGSALRICERVSTAWHCWCRRCCGRIRSAGHLFISRGSANRIKILFYDQNGLCLFAKRLDQGRSRQRRCRCCWRGWTANTCPVVPVDDRELRARFVLVPPDTALLRLFREDRVGQAADRRRPAAAAGAGLRVTSCTPFVCRSHRAGPRSAHRRRRESRGTDAAKTRKRRDLLLCSL